jgi:hypothetical protein
MSSPLLVAVVRKHEQKMENSINCRFFFSFMVFSFPHNLSVLI